MRRTAPKIGLRYYAKPAVAGTSKRSKIFDPTKPEWFYWTELDFQMRVRHYAKERGWLTYHVKNSLRTVDGDPGFPDWVFARAGMKIHVELKREGGKLSPAQRQWAAALESWTWFPRHWDVVQQVFE